MTTADEKPSLCLVCGERGQIYATSDEGHPFACGACDAWGMSEDKVDTPYEENDIGEGQVPRRPTE